MGAVEELMSQGFGFTCAACKKLYEGLQRGAEVCSVGIAGHDCGGPLIGLSFPHYEGPLTRQTIAKTCFMCGVRASKVLQAEDNGYVGVCDKHMENVRKNAKVESAMLLVEKQVERKGSR